MRYKTILGRIAEEEHRNVAGRPEKFQIVDAIGIAYGSLFLFHAATGKVPPWLVAAVAGTMVYIHSERYFYAPQIPRKMI